MKEKVNTFKTIALDTSANEILDFFKKESRRQAARDDEFLKIIGASVEQSHPQIRHQSSLLYLNLAIGFDMA